jgi:transcriptional regulator with XRE-family HTH domain
MAVRFNVRPRVRRLVLLRRALGWTQEKEAKRLHCHPITVCRVETGFWTPSAGSPLARALERLFRQPFGQLIEEVDDPLWTAPQETDNA